jgi:hypothetical protein
VLLDQKQDFSWDFQKETGKGKLGFFSSPLPHQSTRDQGRPIFLMKPGAFLVDS